ncbi:MAG: hypothetical protein ABSA21_11250 [Candidatus Limnocylindrales bacterium]|jgi:hypothetical protein
MGAEGAKAAVWVTLRFLYGLKHDDDASMNHAARGSAARWRRRLRVSQADCARIGLLTYVYELSDGSYAVRAMRRRRSTQMSRVLARLHVDRVFIFRVWEVAGSWHLDEFDPAAGLTIVESYMLPESLPEYLPDSG